MEITRYRCSMNYLIIYLKKYRLLNSFFSGRGGGNFSDICYSLYSLYCIVYSKHKNKFVIILFFNYWCYCVCNGSSWWYNTQITPHKYDTAMMVYLAGAHNFSSTFNRYQGSTCSDHHVSLFKKFKFRVRVQCGVWQ